MQFNTRIFFVLALACNGHVQAGDYGATLADYLNYRPHQTEPVAEERVLQWGKEQGIVDLTPDNSSPEARSMAFTPVHKLIAERYLKGIVLPHQAPDVGVNVQVGTPHVVMFGPEGSVEDHAESVARIGFERFGHYMWPSVSRLRDGQLLVRVYVGGEDPRYPLPHEWLNYVSADGGHNWRHFACYDRVQGMRSSTQERPISEQALRLSDGEEIRFGTRTIELDDPDSKPFVVASSIRYGSDASKQKVASYFRLGDIPTDQQSMPIFSRKPGAKTWTEERSYWDPDTLLAGQQVDTTVGDRRRTAWRLVALGGISAVQLRDGTLLTTLDAKSEVRPIADLQDDGTINPDSLNYVWRSVDRGRTWKFCASIPAFRSGPWFPNWRAHLEPRWADGSWVAIYRTRGLYTGGGPMFLRRSIDQKTWSEPVALRPCSSGIMPGLVLENGIAVRAYGRPGVFLMFCADGTGQMWGNDVTVVEPWPTQNEAKSCNNPSLVATGPDRFVFVYSKFDVPDPWGEPRLAIVAQEYIVSKK
ncbi:MAG: sialidase family protein [Planctomycetota bacterium]|nr:sialidase family protein [Planctomycetota bacterium]MDA1179208.1 sialidase family protein [Planctomycetota bacterium]